MLSSFREKNLGYLRQEMAGGAACIEQQSGGGQIAKVLEGILSLDLLEAKAFVLFMEGFIYIYQFC